MGNAFGRLCVGLDMHKSQNQLIRRFVNCTFMPALEVAVQSCEAVTLWALLASDEALRGLG